MLALEAKDMLQEKHKSQEICSMLVVGGANVAEDEQHVAGGSGGRGCCNRKWRRHEGLCWGTDAAGGKVAMRRSLEESWEGTKGTTRMRVCGVVDGWSDYCNKGEAGDVAAN